jgi:formylglycine-generating enzyme required for sulfatase activity
MVSNGALLTLAPGTTLRFAGGTGLFVEHDGALSAVGTADARILLTGKTAARGSWLGLTFNGSNSASNQLAFVTIEYGGADTAAPTARSTRYPANLTVEGNTLLAITNCLLQESETFGFNFSPDAIAAGMTAFANNTITLNTLGAGRLEAWHAGFLDNTSSFTGNDVDVMFVGGEGPTNTLADVTWPGLDVHYFLASNLVVDHMLTIAGGPGLLLGSEVSIIPGQSGGIRVKGSSELTPQIARENNIAPPADHPLHSQYTLPADFGSQGPVGPSWNDYPTLHYDPVRHEFYTIWDMHLTPDNILSPELIEFFTNQPPWFKPPLPQKWTLDEIDYEYIPANAFYMGSPASEVGHQSYEAPVHRVQMTYGFYLSKTEITQGQWRHVMGTKTPYDIQDSFGDSLPMRRVSWHDAQAFAAALQARNPTRRFRLPTEAEWESAARAGGTTRFYWGDDPSLASSATYAWTLNNSGLDVHAVGGLRPNDWGLLDMSGNVMEWVQDRYHATYNGAPVNGSAWGTPERTSADDPDFVADPYFIIYGVVRGGCYNWAPVEARSAFRYAENPDSRRPYTGFRIVMEE